MDLNKVIHYDVNTSNNSIGDSTLMTPKYLSYWLNLYQYIE
jgi:hypothetical protein